MNIEPREGWCRFCGQMGYAEAPELEQEEINNLVTDMCHCDDAEALRTQRKREQDILENTKRAEKAIERVFKDHGTIKSVLIEIMPHVAKGTFSSVTIKMADSDTTAQLKLKGDGTVRVVRKETDTEVQE